jgi:hypothetical protein
VKADGGHGKMNGRYTKEKVINKDFKVNKTALFKLKNSYGTVSLSSWDQNRITVEVRIKTNGNNEKKVQQRLDEIDVEFDASRDRVSAQTRFGKGGKSWNWNNNNRVNVQVDYVVKLPVKNSIDLSNDYGKILLDRIDGHARINCDYGTIEAGELRGRENVLNFDYTSKCQFGYVNTATINADYSSFHIDRSNALTISADYTQTAIDRVQDITYSCDYGSIEVSEVLNVKGNGDYITHKFGRVSGDVSITADYGSIKIEELTPDAGNVQLLTEYAGVKIGYHADYPFDFEIQTEYADLSGRDDLNIKVRVEKSNKRLYKGFYGRENSGNRISINSEYGGIALKKL